MKRWTHQLVNLNKNQVIAFRRNGVRIECLSGALYVTQPNGFETVLSAGHNACPDARGKICVLALSDAAFRIRKSERLFRFFPAVKYAAKSVKSTQQQETEPLFAGENEERRCYLAPELAVPDISTVPPVS